MSLFRDAIDKRAEEAISLNPSVQTGFLMDTSDVVSKQTKDIWFKTFNTMSDLDVARLNQDAIKGGYSIGLKDTNGVNRKERIFCNPKFADLQLVGDGTGKRSVDGGEGMLQADVIFSGSNNQTPTVVGIQFIPKRINENTQVSKKDIQDNASQPAPLEGELNPGGFVPVNPTPDMLVPSLYPQSPNDPTSRTKTTTTSKDGITRTKTITEGGTTPKFIDKNGKEINIKDRTQRGTYFNSIRTGTLKLSSTELNHITTTLTDISIQGIF